MNGLDFSIEGFSPHCLAGAAGAIAKYKYGIKNLNKLFFHHSYLYRKEQALRLDETGCLNIELTRELPVSRQEFARRLLYYYGLQFHYKEYHSFPALLDDMLHLTGHGEPAVLEIDLFFNRQHTFYMHRHEQHVAIVYGVERRKNAFLTVDSLLGQSEISFSDYERYMAWAGANGGRAVNLLTVDRTQATERRIDIDCIHRDINHSLQNLSQNSSRKGLGALKEFTGDFTAYLTEEGSTAGKIIIPGSWAFMCDTMSCVKWLKEFVLDDPRSICAATQEVKELYTRIGRTWFAITSQLNQIDGHLDDLWCELKDIIRYEERLTGALSDFRETIRRLCEETTEHNRVGEDTRYFDGMERK